MIRAEEVGWTVISAALFWHFSWTITLIPFHFPPSLTMSSPTFLALRPRGPSLGAKVAAGPGSPPNTLMLTTFMGTITKSDFVGVYFGWHKLKSIIYFQYLVILWLIVDMSQWVYFVCPLELFIIFCGRNLQIFWISQYIFLSKLKKHNTCLKLWDNSIKIHPVSETEARRTKSLV